MGTKPSSVIKDYTVDGSDLVIEFVNGKCFRYEGAAKEALGLATATSKGAFFNAEIKSQYVASQF